MKSELHLVLNSNSKFTFNEHATDKVNKAIK